MLNFNDFKEKLNESNIPGIEGDITPEMIKKLNIAWKNQGKFEIKGKNIYFTPEKKLNFRNQIAILDKVDAFFRKKFGENEDILRIG